VVLTKVDLLDGQLEMDLPANETLELNKSRHMNEHCIKPLHKAGGSDITYVTVSTGTSAVSQTLGAQFLMFL